MADKKQNLKIGGIMFALILVGSMTGIGIQDALQSDVPLYKCMNEEKIRNCPNGIKADGKRCYYNESNPYSYDYCSSNWTKIDKQEVLEELYSNKTQKKKNSWGKSYICNQTGCIEKNGR